MEYHKHFFSNAKIYKKQVLAVSNEKLQYHSISLKFEKTLELRIKNKRIVKRLVCVDYYIFIFKYFYK